MKKFFILFFILVQSSFAKDGKEVIDNFIKAFQNHDVVQYSMHFVFNDIETGILELDYECAESYVQTDTVISGFYNIKGENMHRIYSGGEFLEYEPDTYGKNIVKSISKKKNPEKFAIQKVMIGDIEAYTESIVKNLMITDHLLSSICSELNKLAKIIAVSDTLINNQLCSKILVDSNFICIFNNIDYMPVYVYKANSQQSFEATYSYYKFNTTERKTIYSRKAFPKNYKFLENPKEIVKESLKIGEPVPEWELSNIYDMKFSSKDLAGKPVFLIFSKISCVPCMLSVPYLKEIKKEYKDLVMLAIYPIEKKQALIKYAKEKEINYDILYNAKDVASKYFVDGYPTFFFIGKNGKLVKSLSGYGEGIYEEWVKEIKKILE